MKRIHTVTTVVAALGLSTGALVLAAGGEAAAPRHPENPVVEDAVQYVGDPWETRFRERYWNDQHIHDSWNRCHVGENASRELLEFSGC